jgi:hypothetical protein
MGKKQSPMSFTGAGTGKFLIRGDRDGGLKPDEEFPVAILSGVTAHVSELAVGGNGLFQTVGTRGCLGAMRLVILSFTQ